MLKELWLWIWEREMRGYKLHKITGWNSAVVEDLWGFRKRVWIETPLKTWIENKRVDMSRNR